MTIPEVISQLRQVKDHLDRARAAIRQAVTELGKAETLLRHTLGNVRDTSVYEVPAEAKQHLTDAGQGVDLTNGKVEEWIAKILGTGGPGNSVGRWSRPAAYCLASRRPGAVPGGNAGAAAAAARSTTPEDPRPPGRAGRHG